MLRNDLVLFYVLEAHFHGLADIVIGYIIMLFNNVPILPAAI